MIYVKFEDMLAAIPYPIKSKSTDYAKEVRAYHDAVAQVNESFHQALAENYGTLFSARELDLWGLAWEKGHSGGLSDVESEYSSMSVLII